ncbi:MAG: glycosyltransferase family 2 protein [Rickettsiella sp.]|nr:glycosyltransferase family 2 protein [Rickettsiella sp.]
MLALSVIIITKDAACTIRRCLESVKWADEIIIFDSGSSDNTLEICAEYTPCVFVTDWPGFGLQKNRALCKARGKWVLSIDADEELSGELIDEIKQIVNDSNVSEDAYHIKRISFFCGTKIKYGDWGSDTVIRFFKNKPTIQFSPVIVHEKIIGYGSLAYLKGTIFHYTIENISQMLIKLEDYSAFGAKLGYQQGKKSSFLRAFMHGLWCFIRGYFIRFGFLDGREGFILAFTNAAGVFYRYIKLMYLYKTECV